MACFHPLPSIINHFETRTAKDGHLYHPIKIGKRDDEFKPFTNEVTGEYVEPFSIPCGTCAGCRMDKSRDWADRCSLEYLMYPKDTCWFLTLTFDDVHLEKYRVWQKPNGEYQDLNLSTLDDTVLTKFKKDLLEGFDYHKLHKGVRFFACGEYGGENHRPHFHVILFNAPLNDIEHWSTHTVGPYKVPIFRSAFVEKYWKYGYVWIERYDWNNAAYVARYTQKKAGLPTKAVNELYLENGLQPEFVRMSRKPGIGVPFFEVNKDKFYKSVYRDVVDENFNVIYQDIFPLDVVMPAHGSKSSKSLKIPRLFDLKFEKEIRDKLVEVNHAIAEGCKDALDIRYELEERILTYDKYHEMKKETAEAIERDLLSQTDMDKFEYQDHVEQVSKAAYKQLTRNKFEKFS